MVFRGADEHGHQDSWLVSYCDMICLLVTFFLMMMTFSTQDEFDVSEMGLGLLRGRGGIWNNTMAYPVEHEVEPSVVSALARDLAALLERQSGDQQLSVQAKHDGFGVGFDLRSSFAPGSAQVTEALRHNLMTLAQSLQRYTHLVVVEGFTDTKFQPTPEFPTAEVLGLARAQAAARVMLEYSLLSPNQIQIASAGSLRPRATNDTPSGRASNRRVEVRVVSLAKPEPRPVLAPTPSRL